MIIQGKTRKYFFYAIGEILLVMVGILLALQVNNWNQHRQEANEIEVYLRNIVEDLESDAQQLDDLEAHETFRFYSMQYLLRIAGIPEYEIHKDRSLIKEWPHENVIWSGEIPSKYDTAFIELSFLWSHRIRNTLFASPTLDEMKNIGLFAKWSNVKLKKAITDYYDLVNFRVGKNEELRSSVEDWQKILYQKGIANSNPYIYGDPIRMLAENREISGYLRRLVRHAGWNLEGIPILKEEALVLADLLTEELQIK